MTEVPPFTRWLVEHGRIPASEQTAVDEIHQRSSDDDQASDGTAAEAAAHLGKLAELRQVARRAIDPQLRAAARAELRRLGTA